jgi:uncharacterized protein YfaS (alpha-2-macroglobulin family)
MVEMGGRAVERKLTIPVAPGDDMIGVKPLFSDRNVAEGDPADSTWSMSHRTARRWRVAACATNS